jgi:hypothetical protein
MIQQAAALIDKTPFPDYVQDKQVFDHYANRPMYRTEWVKNRGKDLKEKHLSFLRNFAKQLSVLKAIACEELAARELTKEETLFLEEVVQLTKHGSGRARHGGWYPGLFYKGRTDATQWDAVATDVHTDPPSHMDGDPGSVLHQAIGNIDLLVIAVDNGKDRMVYAGPVLSHYEFEMPASTRKSDREWRQDLRKEKSPARPEWTRCYCVPGVNPDAKFYNESVDR